MSRYLLACAAVFLSTASVGAQTQTSPAITVADLRSRLYRIADDSMMGRETGSKGAYQTADYVAAEFRRLGLQPAGENGSWFQAVPFWIARPATREIAAPGGAPLRYGSDYTIARYGKLSAPIAAIYAGDIADTAHWISANAAEGKLVLLDVRSALMASAAQNAALRSPRFARAAAIGLIRPDDFPPALIANATRSIPRPDTTTAPTGAPVIVISARGAERLLGVPLSGTAPGTQGNAIPIDLSAKWEATPYPARNVIGILPGRDPALRGEFVSTSAHNDHVGVCTSAVDHDSTRAFLHVLRPMGADTRSWNETPEADARIRTMIDSMRRLGPPRADSICNGADDDGSGTVALLELAESFASLPQAQRPRRSILFVSHTGEERGLSGSRWFTDHATVPLDSIVAEIDEDMIGRGTAWDLPKGGPQYLEVVGARRLSNEFGDALEAANAAQPVPFVFDYEFDVPGHPLQYYCRADHYSCARYGIPSVAFSRGEHLDYHQVTDEAQYIDYEDMRRVVLMVHDALLRIANMDHRPRLDQPKQSDPHARCVQ